MPSGEKWRDGSLAWAGEQHDGMANANATILDTGERALSTDRVNRCKRQPLSF
jgi:hypothetical protein